jgi:signal transduction histidine kinase
MPRDGVVSRRLLLASVALSLFVLLDIALFAWLIFRSLSQREIEKVLIETRQEAEAVAAQIAASAERRGDLYTAIAGEQRNLTYIDSILRQRELVRTVEIFNPEGVLVYRGESHESVSEDRTRPLLSDLPELQARGEVDAVLGQEEAREWTLQVPEVEVPIGKLGVLQIGISPEVLGERIGVLRRDLIRQAGVIGAVTLALLVTAYLMVFKQVRRARRLEEQAAEAERLAYIGTLAAGLAHEIRNPLNSLSLNVQMLQEDLARSGVRVASDRLMSLTRSELTRLERLVSDFLAYARPRPPELEEVPATALLERARGMLAGPLAEARGEVETLDETFGARMRVDPGQLDQLLLNVAQNALAACAEAGRPPRLRLAARRQGTTAILEVTDNGVGIPADRVPRIFELFYSTRKGGTGLGLAIVQRIAQNHGGRVDVASAPGSGTTVSVVLPGAFAGAQPPLGQPLVRASKSSGVENCSGSSLPQTSQVTSVSRSPSHSKT